MANSSDTAKSTDESAKVDFSKLALADIKSHWDAEGEKVPYKASRGDMVDILSMNSIGDILLESGSVI